MQEEIKDLPVPGDDPQMIQFNLAKKKRLQKAYDAAYLANEDRFEFEGHTFHTKYAKYVLQYLDTLFK